MARPSKYESHVKPRLKEVQAWARDGAVNEEIAKRLYISIQALFVYKKKYIEFSEALKCARAYDDEVVNALHEHTLGKVVKLQKPKVIKKRFFENGKLVREEETIVMVEEEVYVPPDTRAQMYWLNNRNAKDWKTYPVDTSGTKSDKEALSEIVKAIEGVASK